MDLGFQGHIKRLDSSVANQIAAGEVIERPSAALKELLENSIDAKASHIQILLKKGGQSLIEVRDNGIGIRKEELELAVERHSTSKIRSSEDLQFIRSMGFRGEALSSIAAVSRLKVNSRHQKEELGEEIVCEASQSIRKTPLPRSIGTTVTVEDLFFNTPARKKFLKSCASETNACLQIIHRIAMIHPNIHFELVLDTRVKWNYPKVTDPKDRIHAVFRKGFHVSLEDGELIPFSKTSASMHLDTYILPMKYCLSHSRGIHTFVNQRFVKDKLIQQAILTAAKEVLFGKQYPQIFLHLSIDTKQVDINVHPGKTELRFAEPNPFSFICSTIREALAKLRLPLENIDKQNQISSSSAHILQEPPSYSKFPSLAPDSKNKANLSYERSSEKLPSFPAKNSSSTEIFPKPFLPPAESSKELFSATAPKYLGSLKNTYLICQDSKGLLLIDQHAAHERIVYERFRSIKVKDRIQSDALLIPLVVELASQTIDMMEECFPSLKSLGLEMERFGPSQLKVLSFPSLLLREDGRPKLPIKLLIERLAQELEAGSHLEEMLELLKKSIFDTIATQSCHSSIRAGQFLSPMEAVALLEQMRETDFAAHCPHGRPTSIRFTWAEIEKLFKRRA